MKPPIIDSAADLATEQRSEAYFQASFDERAARVDRMMMWLLGAEWLGMMGAAAIISPRVWDGAHEAVHPHLLAAILAGPAFILPVIAIAFLYPARELTRHAIAVAQILVSILLIDCTGGRIETHFHIFGSLAFLALYRDRRVLLTASVLTALDHVVRGIWWPQSVYGIITVSPWRWVEHAWWVAFEDFVLLVSMRTSLRESREIARSRAHLYDGASHDVLTGLANRRLLQEKFDSFVATSHRPEGALLFIDLDRFKHANDTLGHTVGDKLLSLVSLRFAETVRAFGAAGTLARIGGDEFVVFLEQTPASEAIPLAESLIASLGEPFVVGKHELLLSASVGLSLCPEHGDTLATLQDCADRSMYAAKARGRNQYVLYSSDVWQREEIAQQILSDLDTAMARAEFEILFQPLVGRDGVIAGFEALLRWRHPVHGTIPPAEFIPLAEQSGLIVRLGDWVLAEACRTCKTWQRPGHAVGVAVNVSPVQFDADRYSARLFAILEETGIDPSLLTLELTEGIMVRDATRMRDRLAEIRLSGVRIAIDDFGTGYSSLSYLTELPADMIKLDHKFVRNDAPGAVAVIDSVVKLAHGLGMQVVAEGIETSLQKDALLELKCDQLQGYYFSHPIPAEAVAELLDARSTDVTDMSESEVYA